MDRPTSTTITNSGIQSITKPGLVKSRAPAPHPCWNTSVRIPKATPTEIRFSAVEITAIGTLRNANAIITRVSNSTTPITTGRLSFCLFTKSSDSAAPPPTAYSAPEVGERSRREVGPERLDGTVHFRIRLVVWHGELQHRRGAVLGDPDRVAPRRRERGGVERRTVQRPQGSTDSGTILCRRLDHQRGRGSLNGELLGQPMEGCLLYTSDAADDLLCVDLG